MRCTDEVLKNAPAALQMQEKYALFSLAYMSWVKKALEIGTFKGGSARIISHAFDMKGYGTLCCVDRNMARVEPYLEDEMKHRVGFYEGNSPEKTDEVGKEKGPFDFVFVDGNHGYKNVLEDGNVAFKYLKSNGIICFHDLCMKPVRMAIDEFIVENKSSIASHGSYATTPSKNVGFYLVYKSPKPSFI